MPRRISISQLNSKIRQAQQKQKQAIDKYNREVRAHNQKVKQAIDKHNREVRAHNARVRSNQQRLKNEIARLRRHVQTTRYVNFRTSVDVVQDSYVRLDRAADSGLYDERYNNLLDLSEKEAANSAELMNALLDDSTEPNTPSPDSPDSPLTLILGSISAELADRWEGALFSLNPRNPDAARHFCTSAREIVARVLDAKAPDPAVIAELPNCDRNQRGTPTRRAKIKYILVKNRINRDELESFVEADMDNVIQLFQTFNEGTHGAAGKFSFAQLSTIRKRVEDGIIFLTELAK